MHIFIKVWGGGRKIKGKETLSYISSKHTFAYSLSLTFSKIFLFARFHFFHPVKNASMQRDFNNPFIFSHIFGVIIPDSQLSNCTETRLKSHKIANKTSKHFMKLFTHINDNILHQATVAENQ